MCTYAPTRLSSLRLTSRRVESYMGRGKRVRVWRLLVYCSNGAPCSETGLSSTSSCGLDSRTCVSLPPAREQEKQKMRKTKTTRRWQLANPQVPAFELTQILHDSPSNIRKLCLRFVFFLLRNAACGSDRCISGITNSRGMASAALRGCRRSARWWASLLINWVDVLAHLRIEGRISHDF